MSFNLATMLRESAAAAPDSTAVIFEETRISYAELDRGSDTVAANLRAAGVERGQSVGLMLPNLPQFLLAFWGVVKMGGVVVPMNVLLKAPEVTYYLDDSDAVAFVCWDGVAAEAVEGAAQADVKAVWVVGDRRVDGTRDFAELLAPSQDPAYGDLVPTASDDTAVLLYTSGTTGKPKGAELTHYQLYMNCTVAGGLFGVQAADVTVAVLPLFHVFGISSVMNSAIRHGATLTLVPRFDPRKVLEVIQRDRATLFLGVPTMFFALTAQPDRSSFDTSSLRLACSGGAAIPGEAIRAFEAAYGVLILEGYGLSETAATTTFNVSAEVRKVLSIGKRIWGVEVRVVDEQGQPLPPGAEHVGEIVVRGHNVMKGYYKRPEATAEALRDGWLYTGDIGYMDDEEFFFVVDRKKELVIRGGYNVYPREIEEVIYAHPAVAEAAVIGVPDERLGEEVAAVVALKAGASATEADIIGWCKERVAAYKYPRSVRFLDELPKGPTGKILKKELR